MHKLLCASDRIQDKDCSFAISNPINKPQISFNQASRTEAQIDVT